MYKNSSSEPTVSKKLEALRGNDILVLRTGLLGDPSSNFKFWDIHSRNFQNIMYAFVSLYSWGSHVFILMT